MTTLAQKGVGEYRPLDSGAEWYHRRPTEIHKDGKVPGTTEAVFEKWHPEEDDRVLILKREGHEDERVEFEARQGGDEFLAGQLRSRGR